MESVITTRLDTELKNNAVLTLKRLGYTPSSAVRALFEYVVKNDAVPFSEKEDSNSGLEKRIAAFDACHTKSPETYSLDDLRAERMKERYDINA